MESRTAIADYWSFQLTKNKKAFSLEQVCDLTDVELLTYFNSIMACTAAMDLKALKDVTGCTKNFPLRATV
ncbi:hypothetical protein Mapa_008469 [Marchantia paleacea]|nr:hypothetical protein Mapa_008469 [Marchantia paleacea]